MRKDIFIDANVANKFADTNDQHLLDLIKWLSNNNEESPEENAYLLISNALRNEYFDGNQHCSKQYSICTIYYQLQAQDRLNAKTKQELEAFRNKYISKKQWKLLRSKASDKEHVPLVFLSDRKMVISEDDAFLHDLLNFPKFGKKVICSKSPESIDYK